MSDRVNHIIWYVGSFFMFGSFIAAILYVDLFAAYAVETFESHSYIENAATTVVFLAIIAGYAILDHFLNRLEAKLFPEVVAQWKQSRKGTVMISGRFVDLRAES